MLCKQKIKIDKLKISSVTVFFEIFLEQTRKEKGHAKLMDIVSALGTTPTIILHRKAAKLLLE